MGRKGITPVIAIVLLLLITVGAVGIVYTQLEELTDTDEDLSFLDDIDVVMHGTIVASDLDDADNAEMNITLENNDDHEINLVNSTRLEFSLDGGNRLAGPGFDSVTDYGYDSVADDCGDESRDDLTSFGPGDTVTCNTGVDMADPGDPITVYLVEAGPDDVITESTCDRSVSGDQTC